MKKSFKIKKGFGERDFITISKNELPKAYYCFINKIDFTSDSGGVARGKDIIDIDTNWQGVMGWNPMFKIDVQAMNEIGVERRQFSEALKTSAMQIAKVATTTGNLELLEQPMADDLGYFTVPDEYKKIG